VYGSRAGEDYALLLDMQNMNLNNNSQAQHAATHVQVEEEPAAVPAVPAAAVQQLQGSSSSNHQQQQLLQDVAVIPSLPQQQQQQLEAALKEPWQSSIPGDISWQQLLQAEAPVLLHKHGQQQQQASDQLAICGTTAVVQRRSYSLCSSSSGSEAGNNNGSLEQLEEAMKEALSPSSAALNLLPAHGSVHSQVSFGVHL
jgi:hypothetical protein